MGKITAKVTIEMTIEPDGMISSRWDLVGDITPLQTGLVLIDVGRDILVEALREKRQEHDEGHDHLQD